MSEILNLIKSNVLGAIANHSEVPADKKDETVNVATESIFEGLKNNLSLDNISEITNLFSGSGSGAQNSSIVNGIQSNVITSLMQKVGLSSSVSSSIATTVVPLVLKAISGKIGDGSFDVGSLLGMLSGEDKTKHEGGILGALGKLFS